MISKAQTLLIRTPEGILFSQALAGPLTRFIAWLIDLMCIVTLVWAINFLVVLVVLVSPDLASAMAILSYFTISVGYSMATEWYWRGQTLGKKVLRLRVVDAQGLRLHFSQIVIRNLLRTVDLLPGAYVIGGLACLISRRAQRLGDLAANTVVVRIPRLREPDLTQILSGKYNSLRDFPHLAARLRQRISATEASVALQAILRRDDLAPESRLEIFSETAEFFRSKVRFPIEVSVGLTDEQFVRNVLDILYHSGRENRGAVVSGAETKTLSV